MVSSSPAPSPVLSEPELLPEFLGRRLARLAVDVGDADLGALAEQPVGKLQPQALGTA